MPNKAYNHDLKKANDPKGKRLSREVMESYGAVWLGDNLAEDAGKFTDGFWDQKYRLRNGNEVRIEAEIKGKPKDDWWGESWLRIGPYPFKFSTVDIPYRKKKCTAEFHLLFSYDGKYCWCVPRKVMDEWDQQNEKPKSKDTMYTEDEYYYSIPCEKATLLEKMNGQWRVFKKVKTKFFEGQTVVVKMSDHSYKGQQGTVEMVMKNKTIPDAVLVRMPDGFKDWFFGTEENLECLNPSEL